MDGIKPNCNFVMVQSQKAFIGGSREGGADMNDTILLSAVLNPNNQPLQDEKSNNGMWESLGQYNVLYDTFQ